MRQSTKSLDEVEEMINTEQQRRNNYTVSEHHSIMLYSAIALGSVLIILILVIIFCKLKALRKTTMVPVMYPMQPMAMIQGNTPPSPR